MEGSDFFLSTERDKEPSRVGDIWSKATKVRRVLGVWTDKYLFWSPEPLAEQCRGHKILVGEVLSCLLLALCLGHSLSTNK